MTLGKIKKILIPLDGSKNSLRGLDMAIMIARQFQAKVVGLCVIYASTRSEFRGTPSVEKGSVEKVKKFMEDAKTKAAQKGIDFKEVIGYGDVGYNILKYAQDKKNKIDLIVIGSRGRGRAKEMIFGSTSYHVLHESNLPVMIVK